MRITDLYLSWWLQPGKVHKLVVGGLPRTYVVHAPKGHDLMAEIGQPKRPVSVLHFHGTRDEFIPFTGGKGPKSSFGTSYRSVEDSIRAWVRANGCDETPKTDMLSEGSDGLRVTRRTYGGGRDGSEVVLVVIDGGGHTWPGMKSTAAGSARSRSYFIGEKGYDEGVLLLPRRR